MDSSIKVSLRPLLLRVKANQQVKLGLLMRLAFKISELTEFSWNSSHIIRNKKRQPNEVFQLIVLLENPLVLYSNQLLHILCGILAALEKMARNLQAMTECT